MSHQTFKAIFISDLHIGAKDVKLDKLFKFIKEVKTQKIFLVGDIIYRNCKRDNRDLEEFISLLKAKDCELIFLWGNHESQRDKMPYVLESIEFHNSYIYKIGDKKVYINHGDSYDSKDSFLRSLKYVAKRTQVKVKDKKSKANLKRKLHRFLKEIAKVLLHNNFAKYMALKAKKNRCDIVICGHFHIAKNKKNYGIEYFNCGDWISNHSYVAHNQNDTLTLHHYN